MFSFSYFEAFTLILGALTVSYCTYEEVVKRLNKEPVILATKPFVRPQNKTSNTIAELPAMKVLNQRFEVEIKGSKEVHGLTSENLKDLLSGYFIATDYIHQLWLEHPFNLILTDDLTLHFGKAIKLEGFIRNKDIPDIFIKVKTTRKHRTGVLMHELSHHLANKEAKQKNIRTTSHGPLFKKHMRLLFQPLLVDRTYYKKNEELSYHLTYEASRFSPEKDICL